MLGVTSTDWPDDLHIIQVGDLLGGRDDLAIAQRVSPYIEAGHWTQLIGNWELEAVGAGPVTDRHGRSANPAALDIFGEWYENAQANWAPTATSSSGTTAIVTHAGLSRTWLEAHFTSWADVPAMHLAGYINSNSDLAVNTHEGEMTGRRNPVGGGPVWASRNELWSSWLNHPMPWPQIHGHTTAYDHRRRTYLDWINTHLASHHDHHTDTWRRTPEDNPIIGIDPGLWDRSPAGSIKPLILNTPDDIDTPVYR